MHDAKLGVKTECSVWSTSPHPEPDRKTNRKRVSVARTDCGCGLLSARTWVNHVSMRQPRGLTKHHLPPFPHSLEPKVSGTHTHFFFSLNGSEHINKKKKKKNFLASNPWGIIWQAVHAHNPLYKGTGVGYTPHSQSHSDTGTYSTTVHINLSGIPWQKSSVVWLLWFAFQMKWWLQRWRTER